MIISTPPKKKKSLRFLFWTLSSWPLKKLYHFFSASVILMKKVWMAKSALFVFILHQPKNSCAQFFVKWKGHISIIAKTFLTFALFVYIFIANLMSDIQLERVIISIHNQKLQLFRNQVWVCKYCYSSEVCNVMIFNNTFWG